MAQISNYGPLADPARDFVFGVQNSKDVDTHVKLQAGRIKVIKWKEKLERRFALPLFKSNAEYTDVKDVAEQNSERNEQPCIVRPSQQPVEDSQSSQFRDCSSELQPPRRTDLIGFLEGKVQRGKEIEVYKDFNDGVMDVESEDTNKSKHSQQPDLSYNLTDNAPSEVSESAEKVSASSCEIPSSKTMPNLTPMSTAFPDCAEG